MTTWIKIGAPAVCVTTFWQDRGIEGPAMREVCTISEIYINVSGVLCLRFAEHYGWLDENMGVRHGYSPRCFRPVNTLRNDVRAIKSAVREMPAETRLDRLLELLDL